MPTFYSAQLKLQLHITYDIIFMGLQGSCSLFPQSFFFFSLRHIIYFHSLICINSMIYGFEIFSAHCFKYLPQFLTIPKELSFLKELSFCGFPLFCELIRMLIICRCFLLVFTMNNFSIYYTHQMLFIVFFMLGSHQFFCDLICDWF